MISFLKLNNWHIFHLCVDCCIFAKYIASKDTSFINVSLCISRVIVFCARSVIIDRHGALDMLNIIIIITVCILAKCHDWF